MTFNNLTCTLKLLFILKGYLNPEYFGLIFTLLGRLNRLPAAACGDMVLATVKKVGLDYLLLRMQDQKNLFSFFELNDLKPCFRVSRIFQLYQ